MPTWNYLAVEAEGPLRRLDEAELTALLDELGAAHEARLAPKPPWTRAKMSAGRFEAMLKAIIGYELVDRGSARHPEARPAQERRRARRAPPPAWRRSTQHWPP